jgi:hypothetical protein
MIAETIPQLKNLTPEEKLTLSDELWQEVTGTTPEVVDPILVEKMESRYKEYLENPSLGISAKDMKGRFKRAKN